MTLKLKLHIHVTKSPKRVGCLSIPSVIFWTKYQTYRDCWEGSVKLYFQQLQDIFSLFCVLCIIIVAFLENATIGYSLESVCVFVCVFLHDNSKRNRSRNTKSEYIVVYENSSDEFDIELHRIKVKVTVGVQKFSPFTTMQTVRSYSSTLVQARNLILSIYLHLILIYKIYECRHA